MKLVKQFNSEQMRMIHNLMLNVTNKQEMFDYLICKLNLKYAQAIEMSNSFKPVKSKGCYDTSFTLLTISPVIAHRQYSKNSVDFIRVWGDSRDNGIDDEMTAFEEFISA